MEVLSMILGYIPMVLVVIMLIGGVVAMILNQRKSAREWLLLAVTESEKALGGGTGKLKLRATFEQFIVHFPLLSKFVKFETFSTWVDTALDEMKKMLSENKRIEEYVKGDE